MSKVTLVISTFTYRHFQYYAPEFENFWGDQNAPEKISAKTVIIDYEKLKDQIKSLHDYKIVEVKTFEGPSDIFPRVPKTNIYILKK